MKQISHFIILVVLCAGWARSADATTPVPSAEDRYVVIYDAIPGKRFLIAVNIDTGEIASIAWSDANNIELKTRENSTRTDRFLMVDINLNPIVIRMAKSTAGSSIVLRLNERVVGTKELKNINKRFPGKDGHEEHFVMVVSDESILKKLPQKADEINAFDPVVLLPAQTPQVANP